MDTIIGQVGDMPIKLQQIIETEHKAITISSQQYFKQAQLGKLV